MNTFTPPHPEFKYPRIVLGHGDFVEEDDPLRKLVSNETELNRSLLADILAPYVTIGEKSGAAMFTPEFSKLKNPGKIIVFLLSRKAAAALGLPGNGESATPAEISEVTGIPYGSVKPTVSDMARKKVLVRESGKYSYSTHRLLHARELIE